MATLLLDGLRRANQSQQLAEVMSRVEFFHRSASDYLSELAELASVHRPDVVYLDPMYPHPTNKKKAAAVKKEMRS